MIVIVAAALGIPIGVILGVVGVGLWSRRTFKKTPGVFAVKARARTAGDQTPEWPRRPAYALWVHDVLLVHRGIGLVRGRPLPVASLSSTGVDASDVKGLGDDPFIAALLLDSGDVVELATASADQVAAVGPFGQLADK